MGSPHSGGEIDALLAEQVAYYRARAPEYTETAFPEVPAGEMWVARAEVDALLASFRPTGDVLELACGPGSWTP